ncbi:DUF5615 family PIN-like protein [Salinibacter sp.]|uniref:DUF5615 family PIN-like protein n=1 Tax=Salinibacter sp. TaxID=2065818 RepID=UPI0021E7DD43
MGISPLTVDWLERRGHDAVHLLERGAAQARDPGILQWAREEGRILLTHDLNFFRAGCGEPGRSSKRNCLPVAGHEAGFSERALGSSTDAAPSAAGGRGHF